jgi:hypothetical protein
LLYQRGRTWWVQYFVNGRRVRESAETTNRRAAQDFLNGRLGHVVQGKPILPRVDRVRYDELAADLRRHYETTGTRSLVEADKRLEPFKAFFTGCRASAIGTADVTTYVERRQLAGQRHDQPQARDARPSVAVRDAAGSPEAAQTPGDPTAQEGATPGRVLRGCAVRRRPPATQTGPPGHGNARLHARLADAERDAEPRSPARSTWMPARSGSTPGRRRRTSRALSTSPPSSSDSSASSSSGCAASSGAPARSSHSCSRTSESVAGLSVAGSVISARPGHGVHEGGMSGHVASRFPTDGSPEHGERWDAREDAVRVRPLPHRRPRGSQGRCRHKVSHTPRGGRKMVTRKSWMRGGGGGRNRTSDTGLMRPLLCR